MIHFKFSDLSSTALLRMSFAVISVSATSFCMAQVETPDNITSQTSREILSNGTYVKTETSESVSTEYVNPTPSGRKKSNASRNSQMAKSEKGKAWQMASSLGKLPNPKKSYKPSRKAMLADTMTIDNTIREGYTRSMCDIHAAYEQLDPQLYPYQPYYKYKDYYVMHLPVNSKTLNHDFMQIFRKGMSVQGTTQTLALLTYRPVDLPKMRYGYVAWDETVRNAFCAEFLADPASPVAFDGFVRTLILDDAEAFSGITYLMENPDKGIITESQDAVLPWTNAADYEKMRSNRRDQALGVARSMTPLELVAKSIRQWYGDMQQNDNLIECALGYWKARLAYREVYLCHDLYDSTSSEAKALKQLDAEAEAKYDSLGEILNASSGESVAEPKSQSVASAINKAVTAAAKTEAGKAYVKTIFLQKNWSITGSQRSIPVAVVTSEYGQRFIQQMRFVQDKSGKSWTGGRFTEKQIKKAVEN